VRILKFPSRISFLGSENVPTVAEKSQEEDWSKLPTIALNYSFILESTMVIKEQALKNPLQYATAPMDRQHDPDAMMCLMARPFRKMPI